MAEDYYKTLGVSRDASQADIQKAYRGLARKYHPDRNPDDPQAKQKFQEVQAAFDVLNDKSKRDLYDRYGSSFESMGSGGGPSGRAQWRPEGGQGFEDFDFSQFFGERFGGAGGFEDIFAQAARGGAGVKGRRTRAQPQPERGADLLTELEIPLHTAVMGGEAQVGVRRASGEVDTIAVKIPVGIEDGKRIRLRGQGEPGPGGGPSGDILITIHVGRHPYFERRGDNLYVTLPMTLAEAAAGAKVDVPTPKGTVALRVPAGTSSGTKLRIKGHGVERKGQPPGDLLAEVQIQLPAGLSPEDVDEIKAIDSKYPQNPRKELRWI
jgi:DnaJ-class molecular chaperone